MRQSSKRLITYIRDEFGLDIVKIEEIKDATEECDCCQELVTEVTYLTSNQEKRVVLLGDEDRENLLKY